MDAVAWLVLAAAVLAVLLAWTAWTLTRLRRLERRVARAWTALDTQLQRRAELAAVVAAHVAPASGAPDPDAGARLARAARDAAQPGTGDRELAENELGRSLRALPPGLPGVPSGLRADLQDCATRAGLARRFYNDAVRDTRALRRGRFPRALRLHAGRPLPRYFDIDDGIDAGSPWPAAVGRTAPPGRSAPR